MTVPYPDAFLCSNQIYEREHLGMVCKCSFVSVNYSNLEEPWNWEENPYLKDAKYMIMDFRSSQVRTTLILLYHKLLKKCNTFNPIICKSKKKTNLFCFLTTFFKTARFEHENEMRRKALKHTKKFGIQPFWESGIHWAGIRNPVPGIRNPQCGIQNPRLSWIPLHGAQ